MSTEKGGLDGQNILRPFLGLFIQGPNVLTKQILIINLVSATCTRVVESQPTTLVVASIGHHRCPSKVGCSYALHLYIIDISFCELCCYTVAPLLSQNAPRSHLRASNFTLGGACPQATLVLHPYACKHIL